MFGYFRSLMDYNWAIPSYMNDEPQRKKKVHHQVSYVWPACRTPKHTVWNISESTQPLLFSYNHRTLGKYIDLRTLDTQIFKATNYHIHFSLKPCCCLYLNKTAHMKWQQPKRLDLNKFVNSWIFVSKGSSWKFIIAYPFPIFLCHVIEIFVTFSESR